MKKHFLVVLLFSSFVSCFISLHVFAAQTDCPVQLALTDRSGTPVTTSVDYEVHFYSAASGGSELVTAQTGTDTPTDGVLVIPVTCSASLLNHSGIFL